jgi:hypothetical protein
MTEIRLTSTMVMVHTADVSKRFKLNSIVVDPSISPFIRLLLSVGTHDVERVAQSGGVPPDSLNSGRSVRPYYLGEKSGAWRSRLEKKSDSRPWPCPSCEEGERVGNGISTLVGRRRIRLRISTSRLIAPTDHI